jgi:hypothetical protein
VVAFPFSDDEMMTMSDTSIEFIALMAILAPVLGLMVWGISK